MLMNPLLVLQITNWSLL